MRAPAGVVEPYQPFRAGPDAGGNIRAMLLGYGGEKRSGFDGIRQDRVETRADACASSTQVGMPSALMP